MKIRVYLMRTSLAILGGSIQGLAVENRWLGSGVGNWHTDPAVNWSLGHVPEAGDEVIVTNANAVVVLGAAVPASGSLSTFKIGNTAKLIMTNWTTSLSATTITVQNKGTLTCADPFTNAPAMSNRVWVICQDLTVDLNGTINVDAKGYAGAI